MSVRFIHTADWQLGKNYDRISDDAKRERLRRARLEAVAGIGRIARERRAAFILVAGDLFDSPTTDRATLVEGLSAMGRLEIPILAIPGNHDHGGPEGFWEWDFFVEEQSRLAPNFRILLEAAPVELDAAWILPCPLLRRAQVGDPLAWLRGEDWSARRQGGKPVILLAHGPVQTFGPGGYDDEEGDAGAAHFMDLDQLPEGLVDYAALGDWHGTKKIRDWAWYAGTHEPDRFAKGGDHDPGNILLVEARRGGPPTVEKIPTGIIRWHGMEFEFHGDDSLGIFQDRLEALVGSQVGGDLLQLDLRGSLGLEATARLEKILESLEARLLRVKLRRDIRQQATEAEIAGLKERADDPLIALVASDLIRAISSGEGDGAVIASAALQELHSAVHAIPREQP